MYKYLRTDNAYTFTYSMLYLHTILSGKILVLKETIFKRKAIPFSLTPFFRVKEDVCPLLEFISYPLWFFMPLEPHSGLGVETPRLLLQRLRSRILGTRSFLVIEDEEEGFGG